VGSFVEVNRSTIGKKSMVKHLTYLGDAVLGQGVNVGAGSDHTLIYRNLIGHNALGDLIDNGTGTHGLNNEQWATLSDALSVESTVDLIRKLSQNRQEVDIAAQQYVVYDDDAVTVLFRAPLATHGGEPVQTTSGIQTKRGALQ